MKFSSGPLLLSLLSATRYTTTFATALPPRSSATDSWQPEPVKWQKCTTPIPDSIHCATLSVPLDWDEPSGKKIMLGMNRLRAASGSDAAENLFINTGGPGGIATAALLEVAGGEIPLSPQLRSKYNLVGLDPRGLGTSTPIKCDIDLWNERISYFPKTEVEYKKLVQHNTALGESCLKLSGDIVRHCDTTSVVRDFEAVRQAIGSANFNLLSFSYGTQIASQYAELFPHNVGRIVMDSNLDHSESEVSTLVTECALHGKDVGNLFDGLVKRADHTPIPARACGDECRKDVTGEELRSNVQDNLIIKPQTWPVLGLALAQTLEGNATLLSTHLAVPGQTEANSALFSWLAVGCVDWLHSSNTFSDILYKEQLTTSIAPHTQGASQSWSYQSGCIGWPVPVKNPQRWLNVQDTAPILMVNALYDPETSYEWAVGLQEQIPSSVLLTRRGDGHTSYFLGGEAAGMMDAFLVNGTLPAPNTVVES